VLKLFKIGLETFFCFFKSSHFDRLTVCDELKYTRYVMGFLEYPHFIKQHLTTLL